jgi:transcriptional regulator with XRE-family HTH domain
VREDGAPGTFGDMLRRYRWVAGLTQEELARQSGLSVRAVSDIERGHTSRPYARTIRLLADALKLDEPARARLMSAAHDGAEETAGDPGEWIARWREAPAGTTAMAPDVVDSVNTPVVQARRTSSWEDPRQGRWAPLAAASAAAAIAGCVVGWAMVTHAAKTNLSAVSKLPPGLLAPVSDAPTHSVAQCDEGTADLTSTLVRGSNGTFWGTVEVQYSYRCASVWTHFDPSPAVPNTKAVTVTLKIVNQPEGKFQVFRATGTDQPQGTQMLLLHDGCAQGSVILLKLGRELASATTACQAPP